MNILYMCTGILIKTKNGKFIFGRTLEFGLNIVWKSIQTRHLKATIGNFGKAGWYISDGLNKHGLFVATFFFPHNVSEYNTKNEPNMINLETLNLNQYLLKNYKNVSEVKNIANRMNIRMSVLGKQNFSTHWFVCDKRGNCIILEVKNKKLMVYKNKYGVLTNSPEFPEHVKQVKKYSYLSPYTKPHSLSQGTGAMGIPGDSSSQSRFIRSAFYRKNHPHPSNCKTGITSVLRVLHNFDIPLGSVEDKKTGAPEVTEYTVAYCLNNFSVKYAPYGYVQKNKKWVSTDKPVKKATRAITKRVIKTARKNKTRRNN